MTASDPIAAAMAAICLRAGAIAFVFCGLAIMLKARKWGIRLGLVGTVLAAAAALAPRLLS